MIDMHSETALQHEHSLDDKQEQPTFVDDCLHLLRAFLSIGPLARTSRQHWWVEVSIFDSFDKLSLITFKGCYRSLLGLRTRMHL